MSNTPTFDPKSTPDYELKTHLSDPTIQIVIKSNRTPIFKKLIRSNLRLEALILYIIIYYYYILKKKASNTMTANLSLAAITIFNITVKI